MPVIYITDLVVEAKHGYHPHEKTRAQRFRINVELSINIARAGTSDNLEDTVNWSDLRDKIVDVTKSNSFYLVERLAQEIADQILKFDGRIDKTIVSVDRLDAFDSGVPGVRLEASS